MEPRTFCDALNREAGDYLLATVLEGAAQGAQLLLCGGVPVWPEHPAACLEAQLPALQQVTASGVQTFGALRVFAERFGAAPRLVVCGGGHVGASVVRLAKLLGLPVCALEDRPEFAGQLRQAGVRVGYRVKDDYTILAMVESGLGVSVLPHLLLQRTSYRVHAARLMPPVARRMGILLPKEGYVSLAARQFVSFLRQEAEAVEK